MPQPQLGALQKACWLTALTLSCVACEGQAGSAAAPGTPAGGSAGSPPTQPTPGTCAADAAVADTPLRRLSRTQYDNTAHDLLGIESHEALAFPDDDRAGAFPANPRQSVTDAHVRRFMDAAEHLAAELDEPGLRSLAACVAGDADQACAEKLIRSLGSRAYRRPLSDEQVQDLLLVYATGSAGQEFKAGASLVVQALLQAPNFLYHVELKPAVAGAVNVALDDWEVAARLSYFFWQSLPDGELNAQAQAGQLRTVEQVRAQAERLLSAPRAQTTLGYFVENWLGISSIEQLTRDAKLFPSFDAAQARAMHEETLSFFSGVFNSPESSLQALLTKSYDLDGSQRAGILTQPSVLAAHAPSDHTSPVKRGVFLLNDVLCYQVSPPVGLKIPDLPPLDPSQTTRERFLAHEQPGCAGCHAPIDHLGFAFENYDSVGAYREMDAGKAIDATGSLEIGSIADGTAVGAIEMVDRIAKAPELGACVARQWQRFALARTETDADACGLATLSGLLSSSGSSLRELVLAIPEQDSFRFRPASPP